MALPDPQEFSLDLETTTIELHKTMSEGRKSIYESEDGTLVQTVSHQLSKDHTRHLFRADLSVIAADPFSALNATKKLTAYLIIDEPDFGFTDTEVNNFVNGLLFRAGNNDMIIHLVQKLH